MAVPGAFWAERNQESSAERPQDIAKYSSEGRLRVGMVGSVGIDLYYLDIVARDLNFPCREIAIETDIGRLRWCHADHSLLICDPGFDP